MTRSALDAARDAGVDEIVCRPISAAQLEMKLRTVIEAPRRFVRSKTYVGPCRRRRDTAGYQGVLRRLDDALAGQVELDDGVVAANELEGAIRSLQAGCNTLSKTRVTEMRSVRDLAILARDAAREAGDRPLEKTAEALRRYLDGVGSSNDLEPHVMTTGVNALAQLGVLPLGMSGARQAIANLLDTAVNRKLDVYQKRTAGRTVDDETLLDEINMRGGNLEDAANEQRRKAS